MKKNILGLLCLISVLGTSSALVTLTNDNSAQIDINKAKEASIKTKINVDSAIAPDMVTNKNNNANIQPVAVMTAIDLGKDVSLSSDVNNKGDLETFERTVLRTTPSVVSIDTESNAQAVSVTWRHNGKLFALIPITVQSKTTVESSEKEGMIVTVWKPWWSFFVTNIAYITDNTEVKLASSADLVNLTNISGSSKAKAQVIDIIIAELMIQSKVKTK
jgi:hypothetical protein